MNNPSSLEKAVMRRVYAIYILRPFFSGIALAAGIFAAALWGIGREVWVARVLENAPKDTVQMAQFYASAFGHTHGIVQILILISCGALVYVARETAQFISGVRSFREA